MLSAWRLEKADCRAQGTQGTAPLRGMARLKLDPFPTRQASTGEEGPFSWGKWGEAPGGIWGPTTVL